MLAIAAGFWLASDHDLALSVPWLSISFGLIGWLLVAGALAGRQDRRTREAAERLARDDDSPNADLARRLHDPLNLILNASLLLAAVAVVALMVWKPGA